MHYAAVTADRLKIRQHDCVGFFTTILLIQNIQRNNDIQRFTDYTEGNVATI